MNAVHPTLLAFTTPIGLSTYEMLAKSVATVTFGVRWWTKRLELRQSSAPDDQVLYWMIWASSSNWLKHYARRSTTPTLQVVSAAWCTAHGSANSRLHFQTRKKSASRWFLPTTKLLLLVPVFSDILTLIAQWLRLRNRYIECNDLFFVLQYCENYVVYYKLRAKHKFPTDHAINGITLTSILFTPCSFTNQHSRSQAGNTPPPAVSYIFSIHCNPQSVHLT